MWLSRELGIFAAYTVPTDSVIANNTYANVMKPFLRPSPSPGIIAMLKTPYNVLSVRRLFSALLIMPHTVASERGRYICKFVSGDACIECVGLFTTVILVRIPMFSPCALDVALSLNAEALTN